MNCRVQRLFCLYATTPFELTLLMFDENNIEVRTTCYSLSNLSGAAN